MSEGAGIEEAIVLGVGVNTEGVRDFRNQVAARLEPAMNDLAQALNGQDIVDETFFRTEGERAGRAIAEGLQMRQAGYRVNGRTILELMGIDAPSSEQEATRLTALARQLDQLLNHLVASGRGFASQPLFDMGNVRQNLAQEVNAAEAEIRRLRGLQAQLAQSPRAPLVARPTATEPARPVGLGAQIYGNQAPENVPARIADRHVAANAEIERQARVAQDRADAARSRSADIARPILPPSAPFAGAQDDAAIREEAASSARVHELKMQANRQEIEWTQEEIEAKRRALARLQAARAGLDELPQDRRMVNRVAGTPNGNPSYTPTGPVVREAFDALGGMPEIEGRVNNPRLRRQTSGQLASAAQQTEIELERLESHVSMLEEENARPLAATVARPVPGAATPPPPPPEPPAAPPTPAPGPDDENARSQQARAARDAAGAERDLARAEAEHATVAGRLAAALRSAVATHPEATTSPILDPQAAARAAGAGGGRQQPPPRPPTGGGDEEEGRYPDWTQEEQDLFEDRARRGGRRALAGEEAQQNAGLDPDNAERELTEATTRLARSRRRLAAQLDDEQDQLTVNAGRRSGMGRAAMEEVTERNEGPATYGDMVSRAEEQYARTLRRRTAQLEAEYDQFSVDATRRGGLNRAATEAVTQQHEGQATPDTALERAEDLYARSLRRRAAQLDQEADQFSVDAGRRAALTRVERERLTQAREGAADPAAIRARLAEDMDRRAAVDAQRGARQRLQEYIQNNENPLGARLGASFRGTSGSFRQEVRTGFFGGMNTDLGQQLGQTARFSTLYGGFYTALSALSTGLRAVVADTVAYESALNDLQLASGRSRESVAGLATNLGNIATQAGFGQSEGVAAGARAIGLYGVAGAPQERQEEVATETTRVATMMARLADVPIAQSQQQLAAITNSFGMGPEQSQQIFDQLASVATATGQTTVALADAAANVGTLAQAGGFSLPEIASAIAQITPQAGTPGAAAGNLRQVLSKADDPAFQRDIELRFPGIEAVGRDLEDIVGQVATIMPERAGEFSLEFGRGGSQSAVQTMIRDWSKIQTNATNAQTVTPGFGTEKFNQAMSAIGERLRRLGEQLLALGNELARSGALHFIGLLVEAMTRLAQAATSLLQVFNSIPEPLRVAAFGMMEFYAVTALLGSRLPAFLRPVRAAIDAFLVPTALRGGVNALRETVALPGPAGASRAARGVGAATAIEAGVDAAALAGATRVGPRAAGAVGTPIIGAGALAAESAFALRRRPLAQDDEDLTPGRHRRSAASQVGQNVVEDKIADAIEDKIEVAGRHRTTGGGRRRLPLAGLEEDFAEEALTRARYRAPFARAGAALRTALPTFAQAGDDVAAGVRTGRTALLASATTRLGPEAAEAAAARGSMALLGRGLLSALTGPVGIAAITAGMAGWHGISTYRQERDVTNQNLDVARTAFGTARTAEEMRRGVDAARAAEASATRETEWNRGDALGLGINWAYANTFGGARDRRREASEVRQAGEERATTLASAEREYAANNRASVFGDFSNIDDLNRSIADLGHQGYTAAERVRMVNGAFRDLVNAATSGGRALVRQGQGHQFGQDVGVAATDAAADFASRLDERANAQDWYSGGSANGIMGWVDDVFAPRQDEQRDLAERVRHINQPQVQGNVDRAVNEYLVSQGQDPAAGNVVITPQMEGDINRIAEQQAEAALGGPEAAAQAQRIAPQEYQAFVNSLRVGIHEKFAGYGGGKVDAEQIVNSLLLSSQEAAAAGAEVAARTGDPLAGMAEEINARRAAVVTAQVGLGTITDPEDRRIASLNIRNENVAIEQRAREQAQLQVTTRGAFELAAIDPGNTRARIESQRRTALASQALLNSNTREYADLTAQVADYDAQLRQNLLDYYAAFDLSQIGLGDTVAIAQAAEADAGRRLNEALAHGDAAAQWTAANAYRAAQQNTLEQTARRDEAEADQNIDPDDAVQNAAARFRNLTAERNRKLAGNVNDRQRAAELVPEITKARRESIFAQLQAQFQDEQAALDPRDRAGDIQARLNDARRRLANTPTMNRSPIQREIRQILNEQQQYGIEVANAQIDAGAGTSDSGVARARGALEQAQNVLNGTRRGTPEYYRALAGLRNAQHALGEAELENAATIRRLGIDISDPVAMALAAVQDATARRRNARTPQARREAELEVRQNNVALEGAQFNQRLTDVRNAESLGRISHQEYLQYLQAERGRLQTRLNGMRSTDAGYRQIQDEIVTLDQAMKESADALTGQWNIGDIDVPTIYEVRRSIAERGGEGGAASQVNNNQSLVVNGADFARVIQYINGILGQPATVTRTVQNRKA